MGSFKDWEQDTIKNDPGSKYLRLKEKGDVVDLRVASGTYVRLTAYNRADRNYADAEYINGLSQQAFQEEFGDNENYQTRVEYIWVVLTRSFNGEPVGEAQVYAAPPSIRDNMLKFAKNSKYGDPTKYDFEIKRLKQNINDKGDDFYSLIPDPEKKALSKEDREKVDALEKDIDKIMPGIQTLEAFTNKMQVTEAFGSGVEDVDDAETEAMKG